MSEENKCVECGAYHGHSPKCSLMDEKCAKEMLAQYYDVWLEMEMKHRKYADGLYERIERVKKDAEFWKGKFVVVKNENNVLRRKVAKQNGAYFKKGWWKRYDRKKFFRNISKWFE